MTTGAQLQTQQNAADEKRAKEIQTQLAFENSSSSSHEAIRNRHARLNQTMAKLGGRAKIAARGPQVIAPSNTVFGVPAAGLVVIALAFLLYKVLK